MKFRSNWWRVFVTCHLSLVTLLLASCGHPPPYKQQAYVFGTLVDITIADQPEAKARQVTDHVLAEFDRLHHELHAWEPSDLQRLNEQLAKSPVSGTLSPELASILQDATRDSAQGDWLFNPAIGNLIKLWGFQSDAFVPHMPDKSEIARLVKANPRLSDVHIEGTHFSSTNPTVRIDLGGYAKGYALDLAANYLRSQGVKNALINIGGNIIALGQHDNRPWKVGIQHPRQPGAIATLELHDGEAIGTSGDYQRYFELNGVRYCHLIDPRTGWPVQDTQAVTIIAHGPHAGTLSDESSKPIFIGGATKWREMADKMGITEVLRIDAAGQASLTRTMASRLEWLDKSVPVSIVP
jgi:thiamine biosynthesis lipoprotein